MRGRALGIIQIITPDLRLHEFINLVIRARVESHQSSFIAFTNANCTFLSLCPTTLRLRPLLLVALRLRDVESQTIRVQVHLVGRVLQDLRNIPGVLKLPEVDVRAALRDGVTNQFGGAGLTLCADDGGLLLLTGFVDDEGGTLCLLLGDLLGFDGGGEFGGEGEMLGGVSGGT